MTSVVVVGSFNVDHVWQCETLPAPGATLQGRAGKAVKALLWFVLPLLALVLLLIAWPYARYMFG